MKILLLHPGHTFSTSDVFDGLLAGFREAGADVVTFQWDYIIQRLGTLVMGATAAGMIPLDKQVNLKIHAQGLRVVLPALDRKSVV